ncbi:unnamed protein product, partial [Rotaria socialis]
SSSTLTINSSSSCSSSSPSPNTTTTTAATSITTTTTTASPATPSSIANSRYQCDGCSKSYSTFGGLSKHKQFHCIAQIKK